MKYNTKQSKFNQEDDEDFNPRQQFAGYFKNQRVLTKLVVPIDEVVSEPKYYRMVVDAISDLTEDDTVEFRINSDGGSLDGLVSLLHAIEATEATVVADITGACHSAASILAMKAHGVRVSPYASMLVHSVRFGSSGKAADVLSNVKHTSEYAERIFRDAYEFFLSEEEMNDVLNGRELWLSAEEINKRFENKFKALNAMIESEDCCGDPDNCDDICSCPLAKDDE